MKKHIYSRTKVLNTLEKIFLERFDLDMEINNGELKDTQLLGNRLGLNARDLICIYLDIEGQFDIKIPEKKVAEGLFDNFNHILEMICEQLRRDDRIK